MIQAGNAFHEAVTSGAKQRALLYFYDQGVYLTNDDLVIDSLSGSEMFNPDEDLRLGSCSSATIGFSIFNEDGRFNGFGFGRFKAYTGVMVDSGTYNHEGLVTAVYSGNTIVGSDTKPYLKINGAAPEDQPLSPVKGILVYNNTLYCLLADDSYWAYRFATSTWEDYEVYTWEALEASTWGEIEGDSGGADTDFNVGHLWQDWDQTTWADMKAYTWNELRNADTIQPILRALAARYIENNIGVVVNNERNIDFYLSDGTYESYEYLSRGVFIADRPVRVKSRIIEVSGYDLMTLFDKDMSDFEISYPATAIQILDAVCVYCGVTNNVNPNFLGHDLTFEEDPLIWQNVTARQVVSWIAEAAGRNARINKDGGLEFVWFTETGLTIDENNYVEFLPYEYVVHQIDKLQIRNSNSDIGVLIGEGTNGYIIQENPFLVFTSDAEGQQRGTPIYNILHAVPEYTPANCDWFGDWAYEPGDVITVSYKGEEYRFPIFSVDWEWGTMSKMNIACTGTEYKPVMDAQARETYRVGRKLLEITKTIDGYSSVATELTSKFDMLQTSFNQTSSEVSAFASRVTTLEGEDGVAGLKTRMNSAELKITDSAIVATVKEQGDFVEKRNIIASFSLEPAGAKLSAERISLEGLTTINGNFVVDTNGTLHTKQAIMEQCSVTGSLGAGNWTFDSNGAKYSGNNISANMTHLNGTFVGGGTQDRFFYGSTGCDVQYGADYNCQAIVRGRMVKLISQVAGEGVEQFRSACFTKVNYNNWDDLTFYCGESDFTGSGGEKGNIGYPYQPWDSIYVKKVHWREGYTTYSSRQLKKDIVPMPDMGSAIDRLEPVRFHFNDDAEEAPLRNGLIYEDTVEVLPDICEKPGSNPKAGPYGSIAYGELIPILLKEVQNLRKRVAELEVKVNGNIHTESSVD